MQWMFTLYQLEQENPDKGTEFLRVGWPCPPSPATPRWEAAV